MEYVLDDFTMDPNVRNILISADLSNYVTSSYTNTSYYKSTYTTTNYYDKAVIDAMLISDSFTVTETSTLLSHEVDASHGVLSNSLTIHRGTQVPIKRQ